MTDGLIYHYTDLAGLMGILRSKQLWATDIGYLNDISESTIGWNAIAELIETALASRADSAAVLPLLRDTWEDLSSQTRSFVACFCKNGDLLSQWRSYGCQGYSIGFDRDALERLGTGPTPFVLREMLYATAEQTEVVSGAIHEELATLPYGFDSLPASEQYSAASSSMVNLASELLGWLPYFKHPAFEQEHEVRAEHWHSEPTPIYVRAAAMGPTPYVLLATGGTPGTSTIREIMVGPTPHPAEVQGGVQDLLRQCGSSGVAVRISEVPFRT